MKDRIIMATLPAVLLSLAIATTNQAFAWGSDFANWNGNDGDWGGVEGYHHHWGLRNY